MVDSSKGDNPLSAGQVICRTPPLTIFKTEFDRVLAIFEAGAEEIETRAAL